MMSVNRITLCGNSGADAKLETSKSGSSYCRFSICTSKKQKDNTYTDTWHNVIMFGKTAEMQAPLIKKGSQVFVEGEMQHDKYTDKNGQEKYSSKVSAFQVGVITKVAPQQDAYAQGQGGQPPTQQEPDFGDIPF